VSPIKKTKTADRKGANVELLKTLKILIAPALAATVSGGARRHTLNCPVERYRSMLGPGGL